MALRVIPRGKQRLTVYRAHQVLHYSARRFCRIVLGLFVGKQLGVFIFSYISIKLKVAQMPSNTSWYNFYGVGVLTGIGFTMSLFVGNLAFADSMQYMDGVKIGVLTGSLLSTLFGYFLILLTPNK